MVETKRVARRKPWALVLAAGTVALMALPSCTPPQLLTLRSGLDSLRTVVDTLNLRNELAFKVVQETRQELSDQRDILLRTNANTGSTKNEMSDQMQRLEGKLDEVMGRFNQIAQRANTPPVGTTTAPAGPDPNQLYDQSAQDLTQGRYSMALTGFRDFVQRYPSVDLTDNARYGIGECFFAQSQFDSAAVAYAQVDSLHPTGDKVPAALYKLALCEEKLGHASAARKRLDDLVKRFPLSGEAQLARERLGASRKR